MYQENSLEYSDRFKRLLSLASVGLISLSIFILILARDFFVVWEYIGIFYFWVLLLFCSFFLNLKIRSVLAMVHLIFFMSFGLMLYFVRPSLLMPPISCMLKLKNGKTRVIQDDGRVIDLPKNFNGRYDLRSRSEVVDDLRRAGMDTWPVCPPGAFRQTGLKIISETRRDETIFPLGGISNVITVASNELGDYLIYRSDEFGFNNNVKSPKSADILILGDSFAQGLAVSPNSSVSSILSRKYRRCVNLGYVGNGPLSELASLREYGKVLNPKIIVWLYFEGNDIGPDLSSEKESPFLMSYLDPAFSQNLASKQEGIDAALKKYINGEKNNSNFKNAMIREKQIFDTRGTNSKSNLDIFRSVMVLAKDEADRENVQFLFVYLPTIQRWSEKNKFDFKSGSNVLMIIRNLKIQYLDLTGPFEHSSDPLQYFPFRQPGHYTEKGYELVSEEIVRFLSKRK